MAQHDGHPYLMRIMGFGLRRPKNRVAGLDVAGTVAAVGTDVTRFEVGDEVFGISRGSYAEYAAVREDKLALKPAGLAFRAGRGRPDLGAPPFRDYSTRGASRQDSRC